MILHLIIIAESYVEKLKQVTTRSFFFKFETNNQGRKKWQRGKNQRIKKKR